MHGRSDRASLSSEWPLARRLRPFTRAREETRESRGMPDRFLTPGGFWAPKRPKISDLRTPQTLMPEKRTRSADQRQQYQPKDEESPKQQQQVVVCQDQRF